MKSSENELDEVPAETLPATPQASASSAAPVPWGEHDRRRDGEHA